MLVSRKDRMSMVVYANLLQVDLAAFVRGFNTEGFVCCHGVVQTQECCV